MHRWLVPRLVLPLYELLSRERPWTEARRLEALQWRSPDELQARSLQQLRPLLIHAREHVPYYRELFRRAGIGPEDVRTLADLARLPITRKVDLRASFPTGTVAANLPRRRRYRVLTTGSTGLPFEFYGDAAAWPARRASFIFFLGWAGVGLWDTRVMISVPSFLNAPRPPWPEERLRALLLGEDTVRVSGVELAVDDLPTGGRYFLWTLPSYAARLGRQMLERGFEPRTYPRVVITFGETLMQADATVIGRAFRCPVVNHYSCSEVYHLAQTCPDEPAVLHANSERAIVRVVRADGSDAAPGEQGRVVITDLWNAVMPFINYEIGDWAVAGGRCRCGRGLPTLRGIEGRIGELIRTPAGRVISPGVLGDFLANQGGALSRISEFQAVQSAPDAVLLRVVPAASFSEQYRRALEGKLGTLVGADLAVRVETVDHLPPGPSGKRVLIESWLPRPDGIGTSPGAPA